MHTWTHSSKYTHKGVHKCTHAHLPTLGFRCARTLCTHAHTNKRVAVKRGLRLGWDRQLSHASFSANTAPCPSFRWDNLWNVCVHVCTWERQSVWVGNRHRERERCECGFFVCLSLKLRGHANLRRAFYMYFTSECVKRKHTRARKFLRIYQSELQTVRKSTWMWGLSRFINTTRSTFSIGEMSTSELSLSPLRPIHSNHDSPRHYPSHADADLHDICSNSFEFPTIFATVDVWGGGGALKFHNCFEVEFALFWPAT